MVSAQDTRQKGKTMRGNPSEWKHPQVAVAGEWHPATITAGPGKDGTWGVEYSPGRGRPSRRIRVTYDRVRDQEMTALEAALYGRTPEDACRRYGVTVRDDQVTVRGTHLPEPMALMRGTNGEWYVVAEHKLAHGDPLSSLDNVAGTGYPDQHTVALAWAMDHCDVHVR